MSSLADRLPPQDLEAEQATIGACLIEPGALSRARRIVTADDFYREAHRRIFGAICAVEDAGNPVDVVTVGAELRRREHLAQVGGGEYLTACIGAVPTTAHVIRYATIVAQKARLRRLITLGGELQALGYDNPEDLSAVTNTVLSRITEWSATGGGERETVLIGKDGFRERLRRDLESPPGISLARSGIGELDRRTGGWAGHSVIVPEAQSKHGKSIFSMQNALSSAQQFRAHASHTYVLCYILEAYGVWRKRACAWLGQFDSQTFRRGTADPTMFARFEAAEDELEQLPILVNDQLRDVREIVTDARAVLTDKRRFPDVERIGLIVIDHAQRVAGPGDMVEKYEEIGLQLEALSNELRCPIILPSQVTIKDGQPVSKWSRAIEENASLVIYLKRGDEGASEEQLQFARHGKLICRRTREDSFGVVKYYVDVGGGHPYRADLRMYDEREWAAEGFATVECGTDPIRNRGGY